MSAIIGGATVDILGSARLAGVAEGLGDISDGLMDVSDASDVDDGADISDGLGGFADLSDFADFTNASGDVSDGLLGDACDGSPDVPDDADGTDFVSDFVSEGSIAEPLWRGGDEDDKQVDISNCSSLAFSFESSIWFMA